MKGEHYMGKMNAAEAVRAFLKKDDWKFDEADGWFQTAAMMENDRPVLVQINTIDLGLIILSALEGEIPEEKHIAALSYANALNTLFPMGCMYFDTEEKTLVIRNSIMFEERDVTDETVANLFYFCLDLWLAASEPLNGLLEGKLSPDEAAMQTFAAFGDE